MSNLAIAFALVSIGLGTVAIVCAFFIAFMEESDERFYSSDSKMRSDLCKEIREAERPPHTK